MLANNFKLSFHIKLHDTWSHLDCKRLWFNTLTDQHFELVYSTQPHLNNKNVSSPFIFKINALCTRICHLETIHTHTHLHTYIHPPYPTIIDVWGLLKRQLRQMHLIISFAAWNNRLPFRKGALRGTSTSVISTCSCWCCLTRFPSLPALKIFSPSLIFRDRLLKSSFLHKGDLGAVLADKGRAKREGLDILPVQECTCSNSNF